MLTTFAILNVAFCRPIVANVGWLSAVAVFLSFFLPIMYPTIFALGIHRLGTQSKKKAAAIIVMSITSGALLPKFRGWLGGEYDMSVAFVIPLTCFILIAIFSLAWPKLSQSNEAIALRPGTSH